MVIFSVDLKMTLIDTGCHNGEIIDPEHLKSLVAVRKRFLKSDMELASVRFFTHAEDVSAEIDDSALYTGVQKLILDPVSNVSFSLTFVMFSSLISIWL